MPSNVIVQERGYVHTVADAVNSADAYAAIAAMNVDTAEYSSLAYTIKVATKDVKWIVYGANKSDYSDKQVVQVEAVVAAAATGTYVVSLAPYRYYRIEIKSNVAGQAGSVTAAVMLKA